MGDRVSKWNGRIPVYQVSEGQGVVDWFYFSRDQALQPADKDVPEQVGVFGANNTRDPVYGHLLLYNVSGANAADARIRKDMEVIVDLFTLDKKSLTEAWKNDDLGKIDVDNDICGFSIKLHIGDVAFTTDEIEVPEGVEREGDPQKHPLKLKRLRKGPGDSFIHASFEVPLVDADFQPLSQQEAFDKRVLGWAWIVSDYTKLLYGSKFWSNGDWPGLDITKRGERLGFLEKAQREGFRKKWTHILSKVISDLKFRREGSPQDFLADEPSGNALRLRKYLPFKSFAIGAQPGSLGLCSNNVTSYYGDSLLHRYVDLKTVGEKVFEALDQSMSDSPYAARAPQNPHEFIYDKAIHSTPPIQPGARDTATNYSFVMNEMQNTYEEQFLFRDNSVTVWMNSIEKNISGDGKTALQPAAGAVLKPPYKMFGGGKLGKATVFSHDFMLDYQAAYQVGPLQDTVYSVLDVTDLDFSAFKTISIPDGELKTSDGKLIALIGKGLTFQGATDRYLPTIHTKIEIAGEHGGAFQAQAYCHRPLMIVYELEQDLNQRAMDLIRAGANDPDKGVQIYLNRTARLSLPFLDPACGKAGKHLVLLYFTSCSPTSLMVEVETTALPLWDLPWYSFNVFNRIELGIVGTSAITTYRARPPSGSSFDGLLTGNPIVSDDLYRAEEILGHQIEELREEYDHATTKAAAKLILGLIPKYGTAASGLADFALDAADRAEAGKSVNKGLMIESASKLLKAVLVDLIGATFKLSDGVKDTLKTASDVVFDDMKASGEFIKAVDGEIGRLATALHDAWSPIKQGQAHGKSVGALDHLVVSRMWQRRWALSATRTAINGTFSEEEVVARFYLRDVETEGQQASPFAYCFGIDGGWLERDDANAASSLEPLCKDFLQKLLSFREAVPDLSSEDKLISWAVAPGSRRKELLNQKLREYIEKNGKTILAVVRKELQLAADSPDAAQVRAVDLIWRYLSSSRVVCPSCLRDMHADWGWCPYHPRVGKKGLEHVVEMTDANASGSWNDEFLMYMEKRLREISPKDASIKTYLEKVKPDDPDRLMVHRSEFKILR